MSFDLNTFTKQLIVESLVYDPEYGAIGHLSLVDPVAAKEMFIGYFVPEEGVYVIDECTSWSDADPEMIADVGYTFAVDTNEMLSSNSLQEVAEALFGLASEHNLYPSISLSFEDDDEL